MYFFSLFNLNRMTVTIGRRLWTNRLKQLYKRSIERSQLEKIPKLKIDIGDKVIVNAGPQKGNYNIYIYIYMYLL